MDLQLILKRCSKFSQTRVKSSIQCETAASVESDDVGGIIRKGQLGWIVQGALLEVFSLRSGQKISSFRFDYNLGFERCIITCITEVEVSDFNCCIVAVCIQFAETAGGLIVLYSVQEAKVLRCVEILDKVTSCCFVNSEICKRTILHIFDGCLAIGTDSGKVILLDVCLEKCKEALFATRKDEDIDLVPCHTVLSDLDFAHIRQHCKHTRQENVNFGIELERIEGSLVLSILPVTPFLSLAVGLEDGRMILYDLSELQPFYLAHTPEKSSSPLSKLAYLEPPDDPKPCIYIWALHESADTCRAVLHSVAFDKKFIEEDGITLYEGFQSCSIKLILPMYEKGSVPISCQSIMKSPSHDDEGAISLCLIAWKTKKNSRILVFDINQWYKEEMPNVGDWRDNLTYLASFEVKESSVLDIKIDVNSVAPFNSIQRPEEHFHPVSLSFDCQVMQDSCFSHLHWPGLQNRALEMLISCGPGAILEPTLFFSLMVKASLLPQFCEYTSSVKQSIAAQRDILLSVALEYNCFGLLKECARSWADGSYLGNKPLEGLCLSTITEWILKRSTNIKNRCNYLCIPLFDHSGVRIDQRSQQELSHLCRQMKLLTDLFNIILTKCKEYIPETEVESLTSQYNSIKMATEYQEVLQWLLNIGLLPEGIQSKRENPYRGSSLVPYPYKILKNYYQSQRTRFAKLNKSLISTRTKSCRILYIDSFIDHECNPNVLRDHWLECGGNGLYPPPSLQAMLRTLLVPDVPIENKYVIFIYLFLDLNMAIEDERHAPIVHNLIKFPAVFKLNASLIKTVQAFWNIDHGQYEVALEEIISPFSQDQKLFQWQQELLIEALLAQDQPNLALRALQAKGTPISSLLELKTLLANDLVAEAYNLQRSKNDPELLRTFLNGCLYLGKWGVLRDLALTVEESKIVEEFLKEAKCSSAENLHFVYLLQRSKYIEAMSYLEELSKNKQNQRATDLETPSLVLSAYNLTMTPAVKDLAEIYYNIRNKIKPKNQLKTIPAPLSCDLLRNGVNNLSGGIYSSSIVSTDQATVYWDETILKESNRLVDANNVAFIRHPQLDVIGDSIYREFISYPEVYKETCKRRLDDDTFDEDLYQTTVIEAPSKRRKVFESNDITVKHNKTINTSLLTRFQDRSLRNQTISDRSSNGTIRHETMSKPPHILNTPIVKSSRIDFKDDTDVADSKYERVCTPQSILKVKNLRNPSASSSIDKNRYRISEQVDSKETSVSQIDRRNEMMEEEKSIRFNLPKVSAEKSSPSVERISMEIDNQNSANVQIGGPKKRSAIRTSDASVKSLHTDTEEFYSPISSKENSRVEKDDEQDQECIKQHEEMEVEEDDEEIEEDKSEDKSESKDEIFEVKESEMEPQIDLKKEDKLIQYSVSGISEGSPLRRGINLREGPKPRRPLRKSNTPEKSNAAGESVVIKEVFTRQTRASSKTREGTAAEALSSEQTSEQIKKRRGVPLCRAAIEGSARKITKSLVEKTTLEKYEEKIIVKDGNKEISNKTEKTEVFTTTFAPSASSSKIGRNLRSQEQKYRSLEQVDLSFVESKEDPGQILPDETMVSQSFHQIWNNRIIDSSLMTTMDMSNYNVDITFEGFESTEKTEDRPSLAAAGTSRVASDGRGDGNFGIISREEQESDENSLGSAYDAEPAEKKVLKKEGVQENIAFKEDDTIAPKTKTEEIADTDEDSEESELERFYEETEIMEEESRSYSNESESGDDAVEVINISSSSSNETARGKKILRRKIVPTKKRDPIEIKDSSDNETNEATSKSIEKDPNIIDLLYGDIDKEKIPPNQSNDEQVFDNALDISTEIEKDKNNESMKSVSFVEAESPHSPAIRTGVVMNFLTGEIESECTSSDLKEECFTISEVQENVMEIDVRDESIVFKEGSVRKDVDSTEVNEAVTTEKEIVIVEDSNKIEESAQETIEITSSTSSEEKDTPDDEKSYKKKEDISLEEETPKIMKNTSMETEECNPSTAELPNTPHKSTDNLNIDTNKKTAEKDSDQNIEYASKQLEQPAENTVEDELSLKVSDDEEVSNENKVAIKKRKLSPIENTTPSRRLRARSVDQELHKTKGKIEEKFTRATSIPPSGLEETPQQSKLQKRTGSSDVLFTPSRILTRRQSLLLDRIEEDTVLDSPSSRTRSRARLNSFDSDIEQSPMMNKRSRRNSASSVDTAELPKTPRQARGRSVLSEDGVNVTPRRNLRRLSTAKDSPAVAGPARRLSEAIDSENEETLDESINVKKGAKSISKKAEKVGSKLNQTKTQTEEKIDKEKNKKTEKSDTESVHGKHRSEKKSVKEKSKKIEKDDAETDSSKHANESKIETTESETQTKAMEEYSTSRRLTRNQIAVLEKSHTLSKSIKTTPVGKVSKSMDSPMKGDVESETESIASGRSRKSAASRGSRPVTRSYTKGDADDDNSSIASSTKSSRVAKIKGSSSKAKDLQDIPEEEQESLRVSSSEDEAKDSKTLKRKGRKKTKT